ncbi:PTS system, cellobiose-specific IIC component [Clostridium acidisoli DSM 12555]|uniref:Permease IIC component n=1 Tax=Clostridium acidisoli DSM 12555 TaxID=1121291 RepID=A0A1W1XUA5_9CLOT|nr:PTS sugar transporter subunit IIC [Clostridium acidisoli]SMC27560.1 PTS system, cellobiose-specific IIC component [Clostridium acidisoli DSM 12555]
MSSKVDSFQEKILPPVMKFANSKVIMAISQGFMITMPFSLIGSIFLLLANFPIPAWNSWMTGLFGAGWAAPLNQVSDATFNILAIIAVFGVASQYAKNEGCDSLSAGMLGIVAFLVVSPTYLAINVGDKVGGVVMKHADKLSGVIPTGWTGGKGMIAAILVGLFTGYVYSWFITRDIRIKMPDSVPEGVSNAFSTLIPAAVILTAAALVYIFFGVVTGGTAIEWVYKVLEIPMQGLTDSLGGAIAIPFIISFFWWFGVHGAVLVSGVMGAIYQANALGNQDVVKTGAKLIASGAGRNAHIIAQQFQDNFLTMGGSGITIGLVLAMFFFAKSKRLKTLGNLALVPGLFNINEPVLFGFAIVLNPFMFVPFLIVPIISGLLTYFAIYSGLVPCFTAVQAIWTTPPIISGLIVAGWRGAVLQIVIILIATAIYLPFFKIQDAQYLKEERESELAIESDDNLQV